MTTGRTPLRVLVVDDNVDNADSTALLVHLWGHQAAVCYNGPAALREAATFRPDVVLLDIAMPRMDGFEVARRLQQLPGLGAVIFIAVTATDGGTQTEQYEQSGIAFRLRKPVDPATLEKVLSDLRRAAPGQ